MRLSRPFELITPTVDGDILGVLGRAEGPFSGRQIHRLIGNRSEAGIRKGLDRLVTQGIVLRQRVGNTHLHSLNPDHLAVAAIRSLARMRETVFAFMSDLLQAWSCPPLFGAVFGSTARREERESSDIDVLLIRPDSANGEAWQESVSAFAGAVSRATGNDARVLDLTTDELWDSGNQSLRQELLNDAVILRGSRAMLTRRPL